METLAKLFGGQARLGRHLFIAGGGLLALTVWEMICVVAAYAFLQRRNAGHNAAPGVGMAIHAIDLHAAFVCISGMTVMGELNGLVNLGTQVVGGGKGLRCSVCLAGHSHQQPGKKD